MTPWLITIRPWIIPTEARDELARIHHNRDDKEYAKEIWEARKTAAPPVRRSHKGKWPFRRAADLTNVVHLKKRKP